MGAGGTGCGSDSVYSLGRAMRFTHKEVLFAGFLTGDVLEICGSYQERSYTFLDTVSVLLLGVLKVKLEGFCLPAFLLMLFLNCTL